MIAKITEFKTETGNMGFQSGTILVGDEEIHFNKFNAVPSGTTIVDALKEAKAKGATSVLNTCGYKWFKSAITDGTYL